ncbi:MAG: restriction endonuclease subunit S, partial [Clostridia bacterium]|nr:restriction endonuclease subunit S [Clostridia bacterium]
EGLKKIEEAKRIFIKRLSITKEEIEDIRHYCVEQSDITNEDIITPEYYRPLYIKMIEEIKNKHKWEMLGNLVEFKKGDEVGSINYKLYIDKEKTDVPFIRTTDIFNYEIDRFPDFYVGEEILDKINQQVKAKELIFSKDGKIGQVAMITESDKCIIGSGLIRMSIDRSKINPYYLFIALSIPEIGIYQAKKNTVIASTLPHLRQDRISDFVIPILNDQEEITSLAREGFDLKERSKKLIDKTRELLDLSFEI